MKQTTAPEGNMMATLPIPKLILHVALPIIISMTIQGLYNVVDSIFVAKINEDALNAVSLAFPVQNVMIAVAVGLAVGMNAILSRSLGQGNQKKATDVAMNGLFLTCITSLCCFLFAFFGVKPFFASQTDIPAILAYGEEYLLICCSAGFSLFFTITLERTLQATGRSKYTMISQGVGAVVNIILDPIFIFGWFGLPAMEVKGAALATVLGQFIGLALNIYFNWTCNPDLTFRFRGFRPDPSIQKEIAVIAIPSIAMGSTASVLLYYLNQILLAMAPSATAVLGVYFKLQSFVFMPVYGLNNGLIPILAFQYGAKNYQRFLQAVKCGFMAGMGIMLAGMCLFQLFPQALFQLFLEENSGEEMKQMGEQAIKIISYSFPVAAINLLGTGLFQSLGKGNLSLIATIIRQLLIQLPCAYFLAQHFHVTGVWYSFLLAETLAVFCISVLLQRLYVSELLPLKGNHGAKEGNT